MEQFSNEGLRRRREYTKEFKAQLVAACARPGPVSAGWPCRMGCTRWMSTELSRGMKVTQSSDRGLCG
jgi:hypothetical protein